MLSHKASVTLGIPLLAALALLLGCSGRLRVANLPDYSQRLENMTQRGLTVALFLDTPTEAGDRFARELAQALVAQGGYRVSYPAHGVDKADVAATLRIDSDYSADISNILVLFPGVYLLMPWWLGFGWEMEATVAYELTATATQSPIETSKLPVRLRMRFSPGGFEQSGPYFLGEGQGYVHRDVFPTLARHVAAEIIRTVNALPWESADGLTY